MNESPIKVVLKVSFWEDVKGFLLSPMDAFDDLKDEGCEDSIWYFFRLLVLGLLLQIPLFIVIMMVFPITVDLSNLIFAVIFAPTSIMFRMLFGGFIFIALAPMIVVLLVSFWTEVWVRFVGGKRGIGQTINALAYGTTPSLLFGWLPLLGIICAIWSLIVIIIGIRQLHEISTESVAAAVITGIICSVIFYSFSWTQITTLFQ